MPRITKQKKRKITLGKKASKKSLKRYCMEVWKDYVKNRDNKKCVICGTTKYLHAHHIISTKSWQTRYNVENGISLCAKHHSMGIISAHRTPWTMYEWLEKNREKQYKWFLENRNIIYQKEFEPEDIEYFKKILKDLLENFEKDFPTEKIKRKKFKNSLFSEDKELEVLKYYENNSLSTTAKDFNCKTSSIKYILKKHNTDKRKEKRVFSSEAKKNMSIAQKGHIPWNKGLTKEIDERMKKFSETCKIVHKERPKYNIKNKS